MCVMLGGPEQGDYFLGQLVIRYLVRWVAFNLISRVLSYFTDTVCTNAFNFCMLKLF